MIKETNIRIPITFTKKQATWLNDTAKKLKMNKSKLVRWLISNNIHKFLNQIPEEELEEICRIARTPWINDQEDNY